MRNGLLVLALLAQAAPQPQRPVIRSRADLVTTDVRVQDERGQFVSDLRKDEFEVYEDGVKQDVSMFVLTHGGRVYNQMSPPTAASEGLLLPAARPPADRSGRVFLIFVDDFHIDYRLTSRVRDLLKRIQK